MFSKLQQRRTQLFTSGYCELCSCHYANQQKHVTTENHRDFLLNSENFKNLKKELAELSSVQKFLLKVKKTIPNSSHMSIQSPFKQSDSKESVCYPAKNMQNAPQVNGMSFGKNKKHKMIGSTLVHCQPQGKEIWETSINLKKTQNWKIGTLLNVQLK
ncbi:uncharacterized protein LOC111085406 [Limulus polyphemus]|uniref:Uncharacterized protein LOC111085406 n=1 Tax=Limulus polyphemus TaxID=6850 RepID=A0ABM1S7A5_LIMPO|nr:uncharacterized protein LOC111085406 [Limulus polyphemus]